MKALLIVVVLSISLMVVGCQREVKPEPTILVDTVYVKDDAKYLHQQYLDYCIRKDCNRTDNCCAAIDLMYDAKHDDDCPVYKEWLKRVTKKAKAKK